MKFIKKHKLLTISIISLIVTAIFIISIVLIAAEYQKRLLNALLASEYENYVDNGVSFDSKVERMREDVQIALGDYISYEDCFLAMIQVYNEDILDSNRDNIDFVLSKNAAFGDESLYDGAKRFIDLIELTNTELKNIDVPESDFMSESNTKYLSIVYEAFRLKDPDYIKYALENGGYSYNTNVAFLESKDKDDSELIHNPKIIIFADYVNDYTILRRHALDDFVYPVSTPIVLKAYGEDNSNAIIYRCTEKQKVLSIGNGVIKKIDVADNLTYEISINYGKYNVTYTNLINLSSNVKVDTPVSKGQKLAETQKGNIKNADGSLYYENYFSIQVQTNDDEKNYINPMDLYSTADLKKKFYTDTQVFAGKMIANKAYQLWVITHEGGNNLNYTGYGNNPTGPIRDGFMNDKDDNGYYFEPTYMTRDEFIINAYTFYAGRAAYKKEEFKKRLDETYHTIDSEDDIDSVLTKLDIRTIIPSTEFDEYKTLYSNLTRNKNFDSNFYKSASCYVFEDPRFMNYNDLCCILYPGDIICYEPKEEDKEDYDIDVYGVKYVMAIFLGNEKIYNEQVGNFNMGEPIYANYQVIMPIQGKNRNDYDVDRIEIMGLMDYGKPVKVLRFLGDAMTEEEYYNYISMH